MRAWVDGGCKSCGQPTQACKCEPEPVHPAFNDILVNRGGLQAQAQGNAIPAPMLQTPMRAASGLALNPVTNEPWDEWEIESLISHIRDPKNAPWLAGWSPMQIKLMIAGLSALRSRPAQDSDAERYRWLRVRINNLPYYGMGSRPFVLADAALDAAIDAAMSQQEGK